MKYFSLLIISVLIFSCSGNNDNDDSKTDVESEGFAIMTFEKTEHNFPTIKEGDIVSHEFKFKNTGNVNLNIVSVQATCGCTTPEYSKEPIPPGGAGKIKVTFDSKGRPGNNGKKIQIIYNGNPKVTFLKITANVQ